MLRLRLVWPTYDKLHVLHVIFQEKIYQPDKGIAMGSPISGTIAELFLQHLQQIYIKTPHRHQTHTVLHQI